MGSGRKGETPAYTVVDFIIAHGGKIAALMVTCDSPPIIMREQKPCMGLLANRVVSPFGPSPMPGVPNCAEPAASHEAYKHSVDASLEIAGELVQCVVTDEGAGRRVQHTVLGIKFLKLRSFGEPDHLHRILPEDCG